MDFYKSLYIYTKDKHLVLEINHAFSQKKIYIPKNMHKDHFLMSYGEEFANFLSKNFKGKTIYIPKMKESFFSDISAGKRGILSNKLKTLVVCLSNLKNLKKF